MRIEFLKNLRLPIWGMLAGIMILAVSACEKPSKEAYETPKPDQPLSLVQTSNSLTFELTPEKVCFWGDMDTLMQENYRGGKLLFSIESVHPRYAKKFKPLTKRISMSDVQKGVKVKFDLPKVKDPVHLGLYVCKDNKKQGHCNQKRVYNLAKMSEIMFQQSIYRKSKTSKADKPYFFQYMLLTPTHLQTFTDALDNKFKDKIWSRNIIKSLKGDKKYHTDSLTKAFNMQKMLTSRRLMVKTQQNKTQITALMPRMDMNGCGFVDKNKKTDGGRGDYKIEVWKGTNKKRPKLEAHINRTRLKAPDPKKSKSKKKKRNRKRRSSKSKNLTH